MSVPEVGRQQDATAAGNELVPLVLGLMRRLDQVAAAALSSPAAAPAPPAASERDEQLLAALLGVLSVRRTLRRWLAVAGLEARRTEPRAPVPRPQPGAWLR